MERLCGQYLTRGPVDDIKEACPSRVDEHLAGLSLPLHVEQDQLVDVVPIVEVVRGCLVEPSRLARIGIAGEDAGRPLVVAGALGGVPRTRIAGPVIEKVEIWIVR